MPAGRPTTALSQVRGSLDSTEVGSLRRLASALVDLALQILKDEKDIEEAEEVEAA